MTKIFLFIINLLVCHSVCAQIDQAIATIESNLTSGVLVKDRPVEKRSITEWMEIDNVPNLSIAVMIDGKIAWTKSYGIADPQSGQKVDENTLFQAASISKPVAAVGVHKLVQEGKLDLDNDVNQYLTSWKVPDSKFTKEKKVTLRGLMTHSAGVTVHGFPGYTHQDTFPSDIQVLNGDGNTGAIFVDTFPGSINRYSGGGYTIMERVVEDVTGVPFDQYMQTAVLNPYGMKHSTYSQPLPANLRSNASVAYNGDGEVYEGNWHNYPEQAAAGLWTTPSDLAKFLLGVGEAYQGKSDKVINQEMAEVVLTRHPLGHGHGPGLMSDDDRKLFGHGGKNAGYSCHMMASATQGWGMVIMSGADNAWDLTNAVERSIAAYYGWDWAKAEAIEIVELDGEQLGKYVGKYLYKPQNITVQVYLEDGKLKLDSPFEQGAVLNPLSSHQFIILGDNTRIEFTMDDQEHIVGLVQDGRYELEKIADN